MSTPPTAYVYYVRGEEELCVRHLIFPGDSVRTFLKRNGFSLGRVSLRKNGKRVRLSEPIHPNDQIIYRHL